MGMMMREVSSRFTSTCSTKKTKDRPTPPILTSSKRKKMSGFPKQYQYYLGWNTQREDLKIYQEEQNHESDEGDDIPHCIYERYS
jgi:hypothetical protein